MTRRRAIRERSLAAATPAETKADVVDWKDKYWRLVAVERKLQASGKRYAALYDSAPVGYATLDRHGSIKDINLTGAKILGRSRKSLIGGTLFSLVAKPDQRKFLEYLSLARKRINSATAELHFNRPDNAQLLLQLVSESTSGTNGEARTLRTIFSDVTDQRRTEVELSESQAELAAITASAMDAIISINANQQIVQFNAAAETMFRCRSSKAIGQSLLRFVPERFRDSYRELFRNYSEWRLIFGRKGTLDSIWCLRSNGHEFPTEASISQAEVGGEKRLTIVLRDITDRELAEGEIRRLNDELEQRVRERTAQLELTNAELRREVAERRQLQQQLLEISEREQQRIGQDLHDGIGQQLTGVMLLNDTLLGKLGRKASSQIVDARRMAELVAEARVQVRQLSRGLQPVPPTADGLMTALSQLARTTIELHAVQCQFRCSRPLALKDNLLATHLFRIAQEAVHNAVRHGRGKRITLTLSARNGSISLIVQDNGQGFPQPPPPQSGGLGLQIMKSRCEIIAAKLTITPVRPHGTRVQCRLPSLQSNGSEP